MNRTYYIYIYIHHSRITRINWNSIYIYIHILGFIGFQVTSRTGRLHAASGRHDLASTIGATLVGASQVGASRIGASRVGADIKTKTQIQLEYVHIHVCKYTSRVGASRVGASPSWGHHRDGGAKEAARRGRKVQTHNTAVKMCIAAASRQRPQVKDLE